MGSFGVGAGAMLPNPGLPWGNAAPQRGLAAAGAESAPPEPPRGPPPSARYREIRCLAGPTQPAGAALALALALRG